MLLGNSEEPTNGRDAVIDCATQSVTTSASDCSKRILRRDLASRSVDPSIERLSKNSPEAQPAAFPDDSKICRKSCSAKP